jgi:hypothetical protein
LQKATLLTTTQKGNKGKRNALIFSTLHPDQLKKKVAVDESRML